ncbi:MAG: hypothetical protein JNG89_05390 [Planctomycetaceae bacterium]|nr:hypothetical protein [Planctomycetaceae bacterium]
MKHSRDLGVILVCPHCRVEVARLDDAYVCRSADCRRSYPVVDGIPKFLVDDATLLSPEEWRAVVPQNGDGAQHG